jgi:hypothetical protein
MQILNSINKVHKESQEKKKITGNLHEDISVNISPSSKE